MTPLLLGRKAMTNLDSILEGRDITLSTKVRLVKAMVFPVVMYECESWAIKKAERRRIELLNCGVGEDSWRVPWTSGRPSQSILKEINPEHSREGWCWSWNSKTLATWSEELTHWKRLWCWERVKAGGKGDDRGWNGWMASPTRWTWVWVNSVSWWGTGRPGMLRFLGHKELDTTERLNWTELNDVSLGFAICGLHLDEV